MLKHPDEALMDDIGEMWSLECSPKYYVDCWMNMMQKFFDVNDALKGIFKNYRKQSMSRSLLKCGLLTCIWQCLSTLRKKVSVALHIG